MITENLKPILQDRITELLGKPFIITGSCEAEHNPSENYDVLGVMTRYDAPVNVRVSVKKDGDIPLYWNITDDAVALVSRYIGEIILTGTVCVSDPCYDRDTWCMTVLKNVKRGRWQAYASIDTIDSCGERCYVLELFHRNTRHSEDLNWVKNTALGVDSGTMSVIDSPFYRQKNGSSKEFESDEKAIELFMAKCFSLADKKAGIFAYGSQKAGVVCSSGFGDGVYPLYTVEKDGEIVAIKINFM